MLFQTPAIRPKISFKFPRPTALHESIPVDRHPFFDREYILMKQGIVWFILAAALSRSLAGSYAPREGDLVFQSLPHNPLVDAIEGVSKSPLSHCGIVVKQGDQWYVLEALG